MDVHAVADVDAYVVCAFAPEYEVTRLECYDADWGGYGLLVVADAWKADAALCEYVLYKATAVKACRCGAAPYVWDTDVLEGGVNDLSADGVVRHVDVRHGWRVGFRSAWLLWLLWLFLLWLIGFRYGDVYIWLALFGGVLVVVHVVPEWFAAVPNAGACFVFEDKKVVATEFKGGGLGDGLEEAHWYVGGAVDILDRIGGAAFLKLKAGITVYEVEFKYGVGAKELDFLLVFRFPFNVKGSGFHGCEGCLERKIHLTVDGGGLFG